MKRGQHDLVEGRAAGVDVERGEAVVLAQDLAGGDQDGAIVDLPQQDLLVAVVVLRAVEQGRDGERGVVGLGVEVKGQVLAGGVDLRAVDAGIDADAAIILAGDHDGLQRQRAAVRNQRDARAAERGLPLADLVEIRAEAGQRIGRTAELVGVMAGRIARRVAVVADVGERRALHDDLERAAEGSRNLERLAVEGLGRDRPSAVPAGAGAPLVTLNEPPPRSFRKYVVPPCVSLLITYGWSAPGASAVPSVLLPSVPMKGFSTAWKPLTTLPVAVLPLPSVTESESLVATGLSSSILMLILPVSESPSPSVPRMVTSKFRLSSNAVSGPSFLESGSVNLCSSACFSWKSNSPISPPSGSILKVKTSPPLVLPSPLTST